MKIEFEKYALRAIIDSIVYFFYFNWMMIIG